MTVVTTTRAHLKTGIGTFRAATIPYLKGTPVVRWRWTNAIYRWALHAAYGTNGTQTFNFRGINITIPSREVSILPGLAAGDYEQHELDLYEQLCIPGATVVDVGGNIGIHTAIASKHVGDIGTVITFEPVSENIGLLKHNLDQNNLGDNVTLIEAGVSDTAGTITLNISDNDVGTHSADPNFHGTPHSIDVVTIDDTLDTHNIKHVDVIKIDVEGYEHHAIRGAERMLRREQPTMFIEINAQRLRGCGTNIAELLNTCFDIYPHRYQFNGDQLGELDQRNATHIANSDNTVNLLFSAHPVR